MDRTSAVGSHSATCWRERNAILPLVSEMVNDSQLVKQFTTINILKSINFNSIKDKYI